MKPNKRNIRKWIKALRSGDYTQTQGYLAVSDEDGELTHCCLGVACEVAKVERRIGYASMEYDGADKELPESVMDWLGIGSSNPSMSSDLINVAIPNREMDFPDGETSLAGLNDEGATFAQIADLIEREYLTA